MRKILVYFGLQLKRTAKAVPVVIATALILMGCIFLLFLMVNNINEESDANKVLRIGLAGDTDDQYFTMGLAAMRHVDSSRFAVELVEMTEEEAARAVVAGEIVGYVVIPEGFVESVMYGENKKIDLITANGSEDLMGMLVVEFVEQISDYLVETQNAIYGMQSYLQANDKTDDVRKATDEINIYYANLVLNRENLFEPIEIIDSDTNLSHNAGYLVGFSIFLIMMFGITCSPIYSKADVSLSGVLRVRGVGIVFQILTEYMAYLIMMLLCVIPIMTAVVYGVSKSRLHIVEWEAGFAEDYAYFVAAYIPVIVMFAALQYMLFLVSDNYIGGVLLQFIVAVFMAYLGGCLYPLEFFPKIIRDTAVFQPAGLAFRSLANTLLVNESGLVNAGIAGYTLLFLAIASLILGRRLRNEM